jgi:uncharacterized protein (TIGR02118 family)
MVKLVAVYRKPDDPAGFEQHYTEVHTPLVKKMPGLKKLEVTRFFGAPQGDPRYYLMAEMYFENKDALFAAVKSPDGMAAGKDLMGFAGKYVHMMFAEVAE